MAAEAEPDAGAGGTGAPPPENASNKVPSGLTREYTRAEIRVEWYASRCIHSAACIRALPSVFDPRRRPWIDINAASADAIASAVVRCPTGALQYARLDGGADEIGPATPQVKPVPNGPYFIRGAIEITDAGGTVVQRTMRAALCRCGRSKHMPYCDNTHRAIGFRTADERMT
jgi:uncharacterized Fe-S cluster protein YjdI/CDGSH-type Zn-finger protein